MVPTSGAIRSKIFSTVVFMGAVALSTVSAMGAQLRGRAVGHLGQPIPNATAALKTNNRTSTTDANGHFVMEVTIANLPNISRIFSPQLSGRDFSFSVLQQNVDVRLEVFDINGRNVARVLSERLQRGRYTIDPMAGRSQDIAAGVYFLQLTIGKTSYRTQFLHRRQIGGEGLRYQAMDLGPLAKAAGVGLDTLIVTKDGYRSVVQEVIAMNDSLADIVMFPSAFSDGHLTDDPPYMLAKNSGVTLLPLLTVGEEVPRTGDASKTYRMGGIPDGIGAYLADDGTAMVYLNHELAGTNLASPYPEQDPVAGSYVSLYRLSVPGGQVLSGKMAYHHVRLGTSALDASGKFGRFCSGHLVGKKEGFTDWIYMTGEETGGAGTYDGLGPRAVAIHNDICYILPGLGRYNYENVVAVPTDDVKKTVIFGLEDGPSNASQLYLYVGTKNAAATHVLEKNGLVGGKLYVFTTLGKRNEGDLTAAGNKVTGSWTELPNAADLTEGALDSLAQADSSFNFDRIEDGAYDKKVNGILYFVTTGDPSGDRNRFGKAYRLDFDPYDPIGGSAPVLELLAAGDSATGFISPDNMDIDKDGLLLLQEDYNLDMHRQGGIWALDVKTKALTMLAAHNESAVPASMRSNVGTRINWWESSGILDVSDIFGKGSWIFNVQAHSINEASAAQLQGLPAGTRLTQGGQLLLMNYRIPPASGTGHLTDDAPYMTSAIPGVHIKPLLTVGESVPMTGDAAKRYYMGGLPDGMGGHLTSDGKLRLMVNHELKPTDFSWADAGQPAVKGAYVSEYLLSRPDGKIVSGKRAYNHVRIATGTADTSGAFGRFCSSNMAGPEIGLTDQFYFTGEENSGVGNFDAKGPQGVVVYNDTLYVLPHMGRYNYENLVAVPTDSAKRTVLFGLEDGPSNGSQLYMYVGEKNAAGSHVLEKNGLVGGNLYVLRTMSKRNEGNMITAGDSVWGSWVEIPNPASLSEGGLDTLSQSYSSFNFDRIEDGAYDKTTNGILYFVTTGDPSGNRNRFGKAYKLSFDPKDPVGGSAPVLELIAAGDSATGFVSPDNIDINSEGQMAIQEDYNLDMHRMGAVWILDVHDKTLTKIAEHNESAVPPAMRSDVGSRRNWWESSGILDASEFYGKGSWLLNVQAHSVRGANPGALQGVPEGVFTEGGQILLMQYDAAATKTGWLTDDAPYAKATKPGIKVHPILTVGESVPLTGDETRKFRMGGIPDGIAILDDEPETFKMYINHELSQGNPSHIHPGLPPQLGAYVSEYILDKASASVVSGRKAYNTIRLSTATTDTAGQFARFCSSNLAGTDFGFTAPVYLTGEETGGAATFDGKGPRAIAVIQDTAYIIPELGRYAYENALAVPTDSAELTVIFGLEDGPSNGSQLFMYVGNRNAAGAHILEKNGLVGGKLYFLKTIGKRNEGDLGAVGDTAWGNWVEIPNPATITEGALDSLVQDDSSFNFDRIEDGIYDKNTKGIMYFVTTGDPSGDRNRFGKAYKLNYDPKNPVGGTAPVLELIAMGDSATGWVSPDNVDINAAGKLAIQEDYNLDMHRAPGVWILDVATKEQEMILELDHFAVPTEMRWDAGSRTNWWESSGIVDVSEIFGGEAWLMDVQAHSVRDPEVAQLQGLGANMKFTQGGQVLLIQR